MTEPLKVFISWSGEQSKQVAIKLNEWLPSVLHVEPWISRSIPPGNRWSAEIAKELEVSDVGIFCITPQNIREPWINFEMGAIAKIRKEAIVIPYLIQVQPSGLEGPISQFQAVEANETGTKNLVVRINDVSQNRVSKRILDNAFDTAWRELEEVLLAAKTILSSASVERELFEKVRQNGELQYQIMADVFGVGHNSVQFEAEIAEDGSAKVTRIIEVQAFSIVDYLDAFLRDSKSSKNPDNQQGGKLKFSNLEVIDDNLNTEIKPGRQPQDKDGYLSYDLGSLPC
ncbi:MAG: toll/interleukin-1 receptor domain-containing protein [Anaerolineae bacterium]|nr:toll/interleukin-1 receptor domain-containing protein [Anaerolineae bacterium]